MATTETPARQVTVRVLDDLPNLFVDVPASHTVACWFPAKVIEITAATKRGPVTTRYAMTRHLNRGFVLLHRKDGDPWQVDFEDGKAVRCDCPDSTMRPERNPEGCKHRIGITALLSEEK